MYKNGKTYWVTPGGGIKNGETPKQTLLREIKEELGYILNPEKCELVLTHKGENCDNYIFRCGEILSKGTPTGEELNSNNPDNIYSIDFIELNKLKDINLVPEEIREFIIKSL